ncbi:MAG: hypothetical protein K9J25_09850 [Bacteroidales bacterium]|nr:hypothetical protein [Bacteroidales bacterium]
MKRKLYILSMLAIVFLMAPGTLYGQKGEEEKKKEEIIKRQEAKEQEMIKKLEEAGKERERVIIHSDELKRAVREARESYESVKPEMKGYVFAGSDPEVFFYGGSNISSSLQYSNNVREATFSKDLAFEIEEDAKRASIQVSGMCREGEIRIIIAMPSGEVYTEVLIDEYGSINWSKSFNIEDDNGSKTGVWLFQVNAKDATGNFRLSLKSY